MTGRGAIPDPVTDSPPIDELKDFEFPFEEEFTDRVRQSIDRREAASSFVDLSTRGFLRLLMDYLSTLVGVFVSDSESEHVKKEP